MAGETDEMGDFRKDLDDLTRLVESNTRLIRGEDNGLPGGIIYELGQLRESVKRVSDEREEDQKVIDALSKIMEQKDWDNQRLRRWLGAGAAIISVLATIVGMVIAIINVGGIG